MMNARDEYWHDIRQEQAAEARDAFENDFDDENEFDGEDRDEDDDDETRDSCGCSDPCCPCSGFKIGSHHG